MVFLILFIIWMSPLTRIAMAAGKTGDVALTAGIAIPSQGTAVFDNPAALAEPAKNKLFDFAAILNGNPDYIGAFSGKIGKGLGAGLGFDRKFDTLTITPAIGFGMGNLELGVGASFVPGRSFSGEFELGLRYKMKKALTVALVAHDAFDFTTFTLGFAWPGKVSVEVDLYFVRDSNWDIQTVNGTAALLIVPTKTFTALVRYRFDLVPDVDFSGNRIEFGINFWLGKTVAFYGLYNNSLAEYIVGTKIRF